jgi:hypothetical protein
MVLDLFDSEVEILELALGVERLKIYSNVKSVDGWREALNGLVDKGLLEKCAGNVFVPTDRASDFGFQRVACEFCGRKGSSVDDIPDNMWCSHDNIGIVK